jgi:uncharacterized membrane protein
MIEKRSRMSNWRRIALPFSIILNIFLIALIGGNLLRRDINERDAGGPVLARTLSNAEASLSASDAAAFGNVIRRDAPRYSEAAKQLAEARSELERQILADPFNKAAVKQALVAWRASREHFVGTFGDTLVDALAQVSPEGRQRLVIEHHEAHAGNPVQ